MKKKNLKEDLAFEIRFYEGVIQKRPDFVQALLALGDAYTKNKQYEEGLRVDERLSRLKPDDPLVFYNLACSYSLIGRLDSAFGALQRAVELGYDDFRFMQRDPDLANVRKDSRYTLLINGKKARKDE